MIIFFHFFNGKLQLVKTAQTTVCNPSTSLDVDAAVARSPFKY